MGRLECNGSFGADVWFWPASIIIWPQCVAFVISIDMVDEPVPRRDFGLIGENSVSRSSPRPAVSTTELATSQVATCRASSAARSLQIPGGRWCSGSRAFRVRCPRRGGGCGDSRHHKHHHRSFRKRAMRDKRGKWILIPKPRTVSDDSIPDQSTQILPTKSRAVTLRRWWQSLANRCRLIGLLQQEKIKVGRLEREISLLQQELQQEREQHNTATKDTRDECSGLQGQVAHLQCQLADSTRDVEIARADADCRLRSVTALQLQNETLKKHFMSLEDTFAEVEKRLKRQRLYDVIFPLSPQDPSSVPARKTGKRGTRK